MMFLNNLTQQKKDSILGLSAQFQSDKRIEKVNLTVGVFCNKYGITPTFKAVRLAERDWYEQNQPKTYLPILGTIKYRKAVTELVFGQQDDKTVCAYTPGGTGAIRMAGELIFKNNPKTTVWVSSPSWNNHFGIFKSCQLEVKTYPHEHQNGNLKIDLIIKALSNAKANDVVLLHACCHNPTGVDPSDAQWEKIFEYLEKKSLVPFFDVAYHGFAKNQQQDIQPVQKAYKRFEYMMVAYSFSKIMGLYAERVGAFLIKSETPQSAKIIESNIALLARTNYSNPHMHGMKMAELVLKEAHLKQLWQKQLADFQQYIQAVRELFAQKITEKGIQSNGIENQYGLFSFLSINAEQAKKLRDQFAIYVLDNGRINIAGINPMNIDYVVQSLESVI